MNTSPTTTRLDETALARLRELDPDGRHGVLGRVLGAFETSLKRMLVQVQAQQGSGDSTIVAGVAHTLKSSSASVGALGLARACQQVEAAIQAGDATALEAKVAVLQAEGEAALAAVATMLRP